MTNDIACPPAPSANAIETSGRVGVVTRHPGAVEWVRCQGLRIDQRIDHLDLDLIRPGDIVLGILPVNLAGEVCARLEEYWVEKRSTAPARQIAV